MGGAGWSRNTHLQVIEGTPWCRLFDSRQEHAPILDLLLDKGVDLEATTFLGEIALHFAVGNDSHSTQAIVDLLLKRSADTSVRSGADDGYPLRRPLHYAAMNGKRIMPGLF